jgi:predicted RecB family nuclease
MVAWLRCPYAWWLVERGLISRDQTLTEAERVRIERGVEFERALATDVTRAVIRPDRLPAFISSHPDSALVQQLVRNAELGLNGRVDRVMIADGALYPVEYKSHGTVRRNDVLELAFYWLTLAPLRTLDVVPRGVVVLLREGRPVEEWVDLKPSHFKRVEQLVAEIRAARQTEVPPHGCRRCPVCTGQVELQPETPLASEMTLVFGLGPVLATHLERVCSIATLDALSSCDPVAVSSALHVEEVWVSASQVDDWRMHAISLLRDAPVRRDPADPFPIGTDYLAVDLEYDSERSVVWLVGAAVVRAGNSNVEQRWVTSAEDEVKAVQWLLKFVDEHAGLPVVTWYGSSADLIMLEKAAARLGFDCHPLVGRHVDLHHWMVGNVRLPVFGASLKQVAPFFGLTRASGIGSGLTAVMAWRQAAREKDSALRERLMQYNRGDLDALVGVVEGLRRLSTDADVTLFAHVIDEQRPSPRRTSSRTRHRWWEADDIVTIRIDPALLGGHQHQA